MARTCYRTLQVDGSSEFDELAGDILNAFDFDAPLRLCENQLVSLPWWGSEKGDSFKTVGLYRNILTVFLP